MKKFNLLILFMVIALFIAACGNSSSTVNESNTSNASGNNSGNASETTGDEVVLPKQLVLSVYGVGSGTYNDVAAIADAITSEYGTQIRLLPSDTGVGRLAPLKNKTAEFARLGEEYIYAFEGDLDFANKAWGPQDVRVAWTPVTPIGLAVGKDSGITHPSQLKGKKVPFILANPSVNNKMEAYLAFGGLTWDDVEEVKVSYNDQGNAFKAGQIEAIIFNVYGTPMYELDTTMGFEWVDLSNATQEELDRVAEVAPSVAVSQVTNAAGMQTGEEMDALVYSVPITAYEDQDVEKVYQLLKAIDTQYDKFKDVTVALGDASFDKQLVSPSVVPYHDGAIKFLKEKGAWTEEAQAKNDELIQRQEQLRTLWDEFIQTAQGDDLNDAWNQYKSEHLK